MFLKVTLLAMTMVFSSMPNAYGEEFIEYCQSDNKTKAATHTIKVLGKYAGDTSCDAIKKILEGHEEIELADDFLSDVKALSFFPSLHTIFLASKMPIELSQLSKMESLSHLRVMAPMKHIESLPKNISIFWVFNGAKNMKVAPLKEYANLSEIHFLETSLESYDFLEGSDNLTYLTASVAGIESLEQIPTLPSLSSLQVSANKITRLDGLDRFKNITNLWMDGNPFSDISILPKLPNLQNIDISYSKVKDLSPIAGMEGIENIYLDGLGLTELPEFGTKNSLRKVSISDNAITDVSSLAKYQSIIALSVENNRLKDINVVSQMPNLERIWSQGNMIQAIPNLPASLYQLNVENNGMTSLEWLKGQDLPNLKFIDITGNLVSDLRPLSHITSLYDLVFDGNKVWSLDGLESLHKLLSIEGNNNQIRDVSALEKNNLTLDLRLNGNLITDLSVLATKPKLRYLEMKNNPLGTVIAKSEANCPTAKGPSYLIEWCSSKAYRGDRKARAFSTIQTRKAYVQAEKGL